MSSPKHLSDSSSPPVEVEQGLQTLTRLLDDAIRIPGTSVRFGLDALVGLIPGAGDAVTSLASFALLLAAVRYRVPKIVLARMGLNLAVDYAVGAIPGVGDAFDFVWKANRKNMTLLEKHALAARPERGDWSDYAFVFGLIFALIALLVSALLASAWLLSWLWRALFG